MNSGWKNLEKITELPRMAKEGAGDFDLVILEK